jgi:hypothetical protein
VLAVMVMRGGRELESFFDGAGRMESGWFGVNRVK